MAALFDAASNLPALKPPKLMLDGISSATLTLLQADPVGDFSVLNDTANSLSYRRFSIEQFIAPECRPQLYWLVQQEEDAVKAAWAEVSSGSSNRRMGTADICTHQVMHERDNIPFMCVGAMTARIHQLVFKAATKDDALDQVGSSGNNYRGAPLAAIK